MATEQRTWHIRGTLHNADGSVFNQGRILAYHLFPQAGWNHFAESGIDSNTGAFEIVFTTDNFQEAGSPEVEFPTLQIRVTDYNYNPLWISATYNVPDCEMGLGDIIVQEAINRNWTVCGNVYCSNNEPYFPGYVKVSDTSWSPERDLGTCQLNAAGYYAVSFTKEAFQQWDASRISPKLLVRVYSANGVNVASVKGPDVASAYEYISIYVESGESVNPDDTCKVYGTVFNKLGRPIPNIKIDALCLNYRITEQEGINKGTFDHIELGSAVTDKNGSYSISYKADKLPLGLLLDAEEPYGKDKVSLYAKLTIDHNPIYKPLVFNGKREQKIDFELDASAAAYESLFEELDGILAIYRETVEGENSSYTDRHNNIQSFLADVDTFPLVVGRENRTEKEVRSYFNAFSLYYELLGEMGLSMESYETRIFAQGLFSITYQGVASDMDGLMTLESTKVQEAVLAGIAQGVISADITTEQIMGLWKQAQVSSDVAQKMDEQFSPYHVFTLFVTNNLPLKSEFGTAHVDLSTLTSDEKTKISSLMNACYNAGSDYRAMLESLEGVSLWEGFNLKLLTLLIDLCDFGEWYGDFVVAAYNFTAVNPSINVVELKDLLSLSEGDWIAIVSTTSSRYKTYNPTDSLDLPHSFPGATGAEQKNLYKKKLMELIVSWFPQNELYDKLSINLSSEWANLLGILKSDSWKDFDLTHCDSKQYEKNHPSATPIVGEDLEKLHKLQRLFRLTSDAVAIAYLINNEFDSAFKIAQVDEDLFVAEHALGLGTKEKATQIHRVAKSFMAEATFTFGQYHRNLNESGNTLIAVNRGVSPQLRSLAASEETREATPTNTAAPRISKAISPTWKNLFGNINRNGATEGQSVLSASAYFVDILNFFKSSKRPFEKFCKRRPDLLNLHLTKANAEVAMPTIDLINELLECLVGGDDNSEAVIVANQTPADATVASMRAEPLEWSNEDGKRLQEKANKKLMSRTYPHILPLNSYRTKATKILANIPLSTYGMAEDLACDTGNRRCLFVDELLHRILFKENGNASWKAWGLRESGNNVYLPDKSIYKPDNTPYLENKGWMDILNCVPILLDRAGISFAELKEILSLSAFKNYGVEYHCPDAQQYQLADINGYILTNTSPAFFDDLAAFVRFRRLLGWTFADISLRYNELNQLPEPCPENYDPLEAWDRIQEMVLRFAITPLNALSWNGFSLSEDELEMVYDIPVLFERYSEPTEGNAQESYDIEYIRKDVLAAATKCLSLKQSDVSVIISHCASSGNCAHDIFLSTLEYVFRYGTFAQKHGITADELYLFIDAELGTMDNVRDFSAAIRKWQGTSLPISVLEELLTLPSEEVQQKGESFLGTSQKRGTFYSTINESWEAVKVDNEHEISETDPLPQDDSEYLTAYKESCSKILQSLEIVDYPYIDQLSLDELGSPDTDSYIALENWLKTILGETNPIVSQILSETIPLRRLQKFYSAIQPIWHEKQIYTMLSQEFSVAADVASQESFRALVGILGCYGDWYELAMGTLCTTLVPYYTLYKANILYQYVSDYINNNPSKEDGDGYGLGLGFGWNNWPVLYSSSVLKSSYLEPLVDAFAISDACGNETYSYASIPSTIDGILPTPICNLKKLKQQLLIPQDVFSDCYSYAFGVELPSDVDSWTDSCHWEKHAQWFRFFKVYQLYLKTFTVPSDLKNLFIELDESDLENPSGRFGNLVDAVQKLNDNIKANYKQSDWFKFIQNISDEIRKERRDALAGLVCWESQNEENSGEYKYPESFLNTNDIYAYYLIDVLMEPDMSMSRIVQANACLQLFVQRCQLGLEGENLFDEASLSQWEWMKNYQVWVANRKVFLYPENWIDVGLRDDKTPFFEELEDQLQEVDGNSDDIERVYLEYLEKLHDTSNLEIVGVCKEDGDEHGETVYTLHIIGRTRGEPHRYYYRKYQAKTDPPGVWLPWESIDVDIQGDVIFPQIMNGRLYLLWPQYMQGQRQNNSGTTASDEGVRVPEVEFYVEIKFAWTFFNGRKWAGVKVTKNALLDISNSSLDFQLEDDEKINDRYHFKTAIDGGCVSIQAYRTLLDIDYSWKELKKKLEQLKKELIADQKVRTRYLFGHRFTVNTHKNDVKIAQLESMIARIDRGEKKRIKIDSSGETVEQVIESRLYKGVSSQKISPVGEIRLNADGKDEAYIPDCGNKRLDSIKDPSQRGTPVKEFSPENTFLKHNFWVSNGAQPLDYKGISILSKENEFSILPVNMDFYNPEDESGHVCDLPFFYMDKRSTYFVYPKAGKGNRREYEFVLLSHPIMDIFFNQYRNGGKKELYTRGIQALEKAESYYTMYSGYNYYFSSAIGYYIAGDWAAWDMGQSFFESDYEPSNSVAKPYPAPYVNFTWNSPTGAYNWELFFYVPVRIADKLIAEEKYEEALRWLELVFDPRGKKQGAEIYARWSRSLPAGAPFWRFLPFFANRDADKTILESLSVLAEQDDLPQKKELKVLIDQWKNNPFEPHLIAKQRLVAYQKFVVMKYLSVLIARGDELFTQDTTESVNLAVQFYILAANILGPKSAEAPDPFVDKVLTASEMLNEGDASWANTLIEYEDSMLLGREADKDTFQYKLPDRTTMITKISEESFYFNVPRNDTLMGFWDTVADRLYKIRNSLNIEGVKRTLALFAPPIDPGMLVKARAAGLSISDILADSGAALPHYRFKVIVAKALEIARDLRNMQETLLQALKDKDAEKLAQLRIQHKLAAKTLSQSIFEIEMKELDAEAASLELEKQKRSKKQEFHKSNTEKIKTDFENGYSKTMKKVAELREKTEQAKRIASALYSIPDLDAGGIINAFGGVDFHMAAYGGRKLGEAAITMAESYLSKALEKEASAQQQKAQGQEKKEAAEQAFEESIAANEIDQTEKQLLINAIRKEHNEKEQELLEKELERIEEEYDFLCEKFTSTDLYEWIVKQETKICKTMCKLVTKVAKMAEKCYHFEIGDTDMGQGRSFIGNNYWDGAYSGLLSADRLIAALHAMEVAYLENDKNELEITRPVSLKELSDINGNIIFDQLEIGSECTFSIQLSSLKIPYTFCRIRNVRLQVIAPNYDGAYLDATLTMESNTLKTKSSEIQNRIGVRRMATSTAHTCDGFFDFHFKSEKYSPFEGAGLESSWTLIIGESAGITKIDLSDVILHITYTARSE